MVAAHAPRVHIDLGSGDGKGPYRLAQKSPERLFVASDLNAEGLRETAWRASRRPSRGGVPNLVCVAASPEELAAELPGIADRVSVILPWGELLRAVAAPEPATLRGIAELCRDEATVEVVFSHEPGRDSAAIALPPCFDNGSPADVEAHLASAYTGVGLRVDRVERLDPRALLDYPTTWAGRLAHGRPRTVWRVVAGRRGRKW